MADEAQPTTFGESANKGFKEKGLTKSCHRSALYVPLSELRPAQSLGLNIVEMIASGESHW